MILYIDNDRKILRYNAISALEDMMHIENAVWYDGDFSFEMENDIEGKQKVFYLNEDGTIRVEYVDIERKEEPFTEQEQIAIDTALNVEYIACLLEANLG